MESTCLTRVVMLFSIFSVFMSVCGIKYEEKLKKSAFKHDGQRIDRPFRTNKINLVWEKGLKSLKPTQVQNFLEDLKIQDKLEMQLKKRKMENTDDDGEYEALVRTKLLEITHRYGLDDSWIDGSNKVDLKYKNRPLDMNDEKNRKRMKMDKKLDQLWKKAQAAGFDNYELEELQKEFLHHRQKIDEFDQLKNEIDALEGLSDNSIHQYNKKDRRGLSNELKQKHKDVKESFDYLQTMVSKDGGDKVEFMEPKVIELWLLARKANFTEVELESLKVELRHFETKVRKHEYFRQQLENVQSKHVGGKKKHMNDNHTEGKHTEIKKRTDDLARTVKKYHTELKTRIINNIHSEL